MASYLFRGQDRRDIKKSIISLQRTLERDMIAIGQKRTTAISTRQTVFDGAGNYPGQQQVIAVFTLQVLLMAAKLRCVRPATFALEVVSGAIATASVTSGGNYPNLATGTYNLQIIDPNVSGGSGCTLNITAAAGIITGVVINAGGSGYRPLSTFVLSVTGGGGIAGTVTATTDQNGVVKTVTLLSGGGGYANTSGALTQIPNTAQAVCKSRTAWLTV